MASEAIVKIENGHAVGVTAADAQTLSEMEGGTYRAVLTTPRGRSLGQLGLFWLFCTFIADNHPEDMTKEAVAQVLKIEAGHCNVLKLADGTYVRLAKSIAFNAMPSAEFSAFMDQAFDAAARCFGPDLSEAAQGELARMAANDSSAAQGAGGAKNPIGQAA